MFKYVYCIRDRLSRYSDPMVHESDSVAIRSFAYACNNPDSFIYAYPDDFHLYRIATFNSETGEIVPSEPELIRKAVDCKEV